MHELETENEDLRNLLGLRQRTGLGELIPVRKIAGDPNPFIGSVTVDKGEDDVVRTGMTVAIRAGWSAGWFGRQRRPRRCCC